MADNSGKKNTQDDDVEGFSEQRASFDGYDDDPLSGDVFRREPARRDSGNEGERASEPGQNAGSSSSRAKSPFDLSHDFGAEEEFFSEETFVDVGEDLETFGPEQARRASGTYLLTIGYPGSGKSTFHAMLFRYIEDTGYYSYALRPGAGQSEPSLLMQKRMNEWRDSWKSRRFVKRTAVYEKDIFEISYSVTPLKGVRTRMDFSVIEVSGELLQRLDGLSNEGGISMPDALHELLANRAVRPILVIMVDPDTPKNDLLFKSLMDYIRRSFPDRASRIPICAVISKPKKAMYWLTQISQWKSKFQGQDSFTQESRTAYLKEFAPGVYAHLKTLEKSKRLLAPFSIGVIKSRDYEEDGKQIKEEYLSQVDYRDTYTIFSWLYFQSTGKKLGKTPLQRLIGALR